jgi:Flp pilus assembly protein TadB
MAQTKRKRRSKHRGNAAGTIQARGRTGRPPTATERKAQTKVQARERRLNTPPTWKSSFQRAGLASALMFVFLVATTKHNRVAVAGSFALIAMLLYVPAGYYFELMLYRRRMRKKTASAAADPPRRKEGGK